jgi:hypothetical protein
MWRGRPARTAELLDCFLSLVIPNRCEAAATNLLFRPLCAEPSRPLSQGLMLKSLPDGPNHATTVVQSGNWRDPT